MFGLKRRVDNEMKLKKERIVRTDEDEYRDEEWVDNAVPKRLRGPIEVFHKIYYNDINDHYNETNGWTSKLAKARYNEMIALQSGKKTRMKQNIKVKKKYVRKCLESCQLVYFQLNPPLVKKNLKLKMSN